MENLPEEIKYKIAEQLSDEDFKSLVKSGKSFSYLDDDDNLWKKKVNEKYGEVPKIKNWKNTYELMHMRIYVINIHRYPEEGDPDDKETYAIYSNLDFAIKNIFKFLIKKLWVFETSDNINNFRDILLLGVDFPNSERKKIKECIKHMNLTKEEEIELIDLYKKYRIDQTYDQILVKKFKENSVGNRYYKYLKSIIYKDLSESFIYRARNYNIEIESRLLNRTFD